MPAGTNDLVASRPSAITLLSLHRREVFHCNKLGLAALADCTVISPMRRKAWKARQNIASYKGLWCFPGTVKSRAPNSLLSMGMSMGILRSNCLLSLWHADNNFWTKKVVVGLLPLVVYVCTQWLTCVMILWLVNTLPYEDVR